MEHKFWPAFFVSESQTKGGDRMLYSTGRLAQTLGVCNRTIYRWEESGILPKSMRVNGYRYWTEDQVDRIKNGLETASHSTASEA